MDNKDIAGDHTQDLLVNFGDSPSQVRKETADFLRRETDSMDDFEHLEHDNHSQQETKVDKPLETKYDDLLNLGDNSRGETEINTAKEGEITQKTFDDFMLESEPAKITEKINNLAEEPKKIVDDFLGLMKEAPPVPPHAEPLETENKGFGDFTSKPQNPILDSQHFMEMERSFSPAKTPDIADRFSDSEPEIDDFKPSSPESFQYQKPEPKTEDFTKTETFKDFEPEPLPEKDYFESSYDNVPKYEPESVFERKSEPVLVPEPVMEVPKPVIQEPKFVIDEPKPVIKEPEPEPVREEPKPVQKEPEPVKKPAEPPKVVKCTFEKPKRETMGAELMFCKMGLGK